jgi:hypothetical protein
VTVDSVPRDGVVDHVCCWGSEPLPFPDESFDLVYAAHVLEHIPWYQTLDALRETARVLAPGGRIELHVPDFDVLARAASSQACLDDFSEQGLNERLHWMHWVAERLFHLGPQEQWHRACFNQGHLKWCLEQAGFGEVRPIAGERGSDHGIINLGMTATRPAMPSPAANGNIYGSRSAHAAGDQAPAAAGAPVDARLEEIDQADVPGAEDLLLCHSRREYDAPAKIFFCAHPNVHLSGQLASADVCRRCTRSQEPPPDEFRPYVNHAGVVRQGPCWYLGEFVGLRECGSCRGQVQTKVFACRHPEHETTTVNDCLKCPDYEQRLSVGAAAKWAVGVTTAPRRSPTLGRTLHSLRSAGWDSIRLFAERDSLVPAMTVATDLSVTRRESTLGAWPNWYLGLAELYQRDPLADAYLMVQDDVIFCANLRPVLENTLWPEERLAVVSLYDPLPESGRGAEPGYRRLSTSGGLPGALALAFPNLAARLLLSDRQVLLHRRRGPSQALKLIDVVVGQWAERHQLSAWSYFPSLCQHVGHTSTIWPETEDRVKRQAIGFVGESFDALELLDGQRDVAGRNCEALVASS